MLTRGGKRVFLKAFVVVLVVVLFYFLLKLAPGSLISGRASLDLDIESVGEVIGGRVVFGSKGGELIPADSIVRVSLNEQSKEIKLSELVSPNTEGEFYVEGSEISGRGEVSGLKTIEKALIRQLWNGTTKQLKHWKEWLMIFPM